MVIRDVRTLKRLSGEKGWNIGIVKSVMDIMFILIITYVQTVWRVIMYKWTLLFELILEEVLDLLKEYNYSEENKWFGIFYIGELWKHGL